MHSLITWIGKLIGTMIGGPGVVVLGDPALDADPATRSWSPLAYRVLGLVLVMGILLFAGMPWQMVGIVAVVAAGLIGLEHLRGTRNRD